MFVYDSRVKVILIIYTYIDKDRYSLGTVT